MIPADEFELADLELNDPEIKDWIYVDIFRCSNGNELFDIVYNDDSGFAGDKPYCEMCRLEKLES